VTEYLADILGKAAIMLVMNHSEQNTVQLSSGQDQISVMRH
jgi:hypothetical protein